MSRDTVKPTSALARRAVTTRRVPNPGVTRLRKDADNKILEKSTEIADSLAKQAIGGNASSARLLVDLADNANWIQQPDSVAQVLSIAVNQWKKEQPEKRGDIDLDIVTNPPKLQPPPRPQLTNGQPEIADAEFTDAEPTP
jgi:hypothetical protein